MALNKNQLLTQIGNTIDAAQASVDKRAITIFQDADTKYKIVVELGIEDKLTVTRRTIS